MIVLGIDPGLASTGYALVEEREGKLELLSAGCLRTPSTMPEPERLCQIYFGIMQILQKTLVDAVAIEQLFFNTNVTTALSVGQARGVIVLAVALSGIQTAEYTPLQVKQAISGYGRADKTQIGRMVQSVLRLPDLIKPDDAADAAAIAICHLQSYRHAKAIARGLNNV
ncbi:MAG: crossover junction endodeoxyribonuclease RuvC [bacterium]|nr:crossover junction endodeoxyribonuclease RuvC [bacterium]